MTISALCFFNVANRSTFSQIFKRDMHTPEALARRRAIVIATGARYVRADRGPEDFYPDGVAAALLGAWLGKPFIVTARGSDLNVIGGFRLPAAQMRWAANRAVANIAVSIPELVL